MRTVQFPPDFVWGAATAAYQVEGAYNVDGRGMSIWDTFARIPGKVANMENGDVACDSYHRFREDIALMKELGIQAYRFSVAWPRIFPEGAGELNADGLVYYETLVNALLENGIEPVCTLYHWDLPQALQDSGGWENRATVDAFAAYAETLFRKLGGKIKKWLTVNEPWCASFLSHYYGEHAPGARDLQTAVTVSHHLLLAHGRAVRKFRETGIQGEIGYAPNVTWMEPYSTRKKDTEACKRENGWYVEWFMDPVFKGDYPGFLVKWFREKGAKVPIQDGDMEIIREKIDMLGINYYSGSVGKYGEDAGLMACERIDMGEDRTDIGWQIYPEGFYKVLSYINSRYGDIPIYITENGACYNDGPVKGMVPDPKRIGYMRKHLLQLHRCVANGIPVKGYFAWSLIDNFEWAYGYSMRFGLIHVDYDTLVRTPKDSFYWYQDVIATGGEVEV